MYFKAREIYELATIKMNERRRHNVAVRIGVEPDRGFDDSIEI